MNPDQHKAHYTLAELTRDLAVTIQGDSSCLIRGVQTIQQAKTSDITFLMNPLYKKFLANTNASAVIVSPSDAKDCPVTAVIARDPYFVYAKIAAFFEKKCKIPMGVHPSSVIGEHVEIDPTASIGPLCVIGNHVKIGPRVSIGPRCVIGDETEIDEETTLDASVTLYERTKIGKRAHLASGVVIGSDGFGLAKHEGVWHKVPQLGRVVIGDDVEIGANSAIDRGAIDDTLIEKGVKLDNLIQVGHNVTIGEHTAIAGCVGIAGSATIGKNCMVGGAAGIGGHIHIVDNVVVTGMTAVTKSINQPGVYSSGVGGVVTNLEWRKNSARLLRLDQLIQRVKTLEVIIEELTERKES